MLKRLRIKFVCINMGIVLAMLVVIFALVIGTTRQNLARESLALMHSALNERGPRNQRPVFRDRDTDTSPETLPLPSAQPAEIPAAPPEADGETGTEPPEPRELFDMFLPYILLRLTPEGTLEGYEGFLSPEWEAQSTERLALLAAEAMAQSEDAGILNSWNLRYLRETTPMGTRIVFVDRTNENSTLKGLVRTSLLIGAASLAAFFCISLLLARWAVKPVEAAWQQQKQFVSDASHELKTPLTVIMTNAELLQSPDYDAETRRRFAENVLTMARQMRGLVEGLLELARVDNGAVETAAAELELSRLLEDAALPFEPVLFEKGHTLRCEIAPGIRVCGSESHLRQAAEILLDNAGKYAAPGAEIRLSLRRSGRSALLCVANPGEPIAAEELGRLFERFYRADKSRSRDGSYGLGLSIAQKIAESHHGRIWAESEGGENRFYVSLPAL